MLCSLLPGDAAIVALASDQALPSMKYGMAFGVFKNKLDGGAPRRLPRSRRQSTVLRKMLALVTLAAVANGPKSQTC